MVKLLISLSIISIIGTLIWAIWWWFFSDEITVRSKIIDRASVSWIILGLSMFSKTAESIILFMTSSIILLIILATWWFSDTSIK